MMEAVGLRAEDLGRRPSEFSGGQRQRISLARALISSPSALICDEVVSALDVSIQGQILNLLIDLKQKFHLTMIFIAHDLTVVSYMADRIGVLYGGSLMEEAPTAALVESPLHPYTQLLYTRHSSAGRKLPDRGATGGAPVQPDAAAGRVPVCRALPPGAGHLSHGQARAARGQARPQGGLPLRRLTRVWPRSDSRELPQRLEDILGKVPLVLDAHGQAASGLR